MDESYEIEFEESISLKQLPLNALVVPTTASPAGGFGSSGTPSSSRLPPLPPQLSPISTRTPLKRQTSTNQKSFGSHTHEMQSIHPKKMEENAIMPEVEFEEELEITENRPNVSFSGVSATGSKKNEPIHVMRSITPVLPDVEVATVPVFQPLVAFAEEEITIETVRDVKEPQVVVKVMQPAPVVPTITTAEVEDIEIEVEENVKEIVKTNVNSIKDDVKEDIESNEIPEEVSEVPKEVEEEYGNEEFEVEEEEEVKKTEGLTILMTTPPPVINTTSNNNNNNTTTTTTTTSTITTREPTTCCPGCCSYSECIYTHMFPTLCPGPAVIRKNTSHPHSHVTAHDCFSEKQCYVISSCTFHSSALLPSFYANITKKKDAKYVKTNTHKSGFGSTNARFKIPHVPYKCSCEEEGCTEHTPIPVQKEPETEPCDNPHCRQHGHGRYVCPECLGYLIGYAKKKTDKFQHLITFFGCNAKIQQSGLDTEQTCTNQYCLLHHPENQKAPKTSQKCDFWERQVFEDKERMEQQDLAQYQRILDEQKKAGTVPVSYCHAGDVVPSILQHISTLQTTETLTDVVRGDMIESMQIMAHSFETNNPQEQKVPVVGSGVAVRDRSSSSIRSIQLIDSLLQFQKSTRPMGDKPVREYMSEESAALQRIMEGGSNNTVMGMSLHTNHLSSILQPKPTFALPASSNTHQEHQKYVDTEHCKHIHVHIHSDGNHSINNNPNNMLKTPQKSSRTSSLTTSIGLTPRQGKTPRTPRTPRTSGLTPRDDVLQHLQSSQDMESVMFSQIPSNNPRDYFTVTTEERDKCDICKYRYADYICTNQHEDTDSSIWKQTGDQTLDEIERLNQKNSSIAASRKANYIACELVQCRQDYEQLHEPGYMKAHIPYPAESHPVTKYKLYPEALLRMLIANFGAEWVERNYPKHRRSHVHCCDEEKTPRSTIKTIPRTPVTVKVGLRTPSTNTPGHRKLLTYTKDVDGFKSIQRRLDLPVEMLHKPYIEPSRR